jgi:hypothetical protein
MVPSNPYTAPAEIEARARDATAHSYVPLDGRTKAATIAIATAAVFDVAVDIAGVTGAATPPERPSFTTALVLLGAAIGLLGSVLASVILYSVWLHRAVRNLRGLGRTGMSFTPSRAVASFYIPLINLVRPARAVSELLRASDADGAADGAGWKTVSESSPIVAIWWAAWITTNLVANGLQAAGNSTSAAWGFIGSGLFAASAVLCILVMQAVARRQTALAVRLQVEPR